MSKPSERDREMARIIYERIVYIPSDDEEFWSGQLAGEEMSFICTCLAAVRRRAIEECAALVNPGCWPTQIHRECAEEVNDAIRALAESPICKESLRTAEPTADKQKPPQR